jgi:hypothetical protein
MTFSDSKCKSISQVTFPAKKIIFLWKRPDLLGVYLEFLLRSIPNAEIIVGECNQVESLEQQVGKINPDVMLLFKDDVATGEELPNILNTSQQSLQVIIVHPQNNTVEIITKQQVSLSTSSDLFSIIEGNPALIELQ